MKYDNEDSPAEFINDGAIPSPSAYMPSSRPLADGRDEGGDHASKTESLVLPAFVIAIESIILAMFITFIQSGFAGIGRLSQRCPSNWRRRLVPSMSVCNSVWIAGSPTRGKASVNNHKERLELRQSSRLARLGSASHCLSLNFKFAFVTPDF
jgi:hypothetical protein